jgi:hypothetical protein
MGHHAIPEKAQLRSPVVMFYAPLRTMIYIDSADRTRLAVDQPSTVYASFAVRSSPNSTASSPTCSTRGVEAGPWMLQRGGRRRTSSSSSPSASISASMP